MEEEKIFQFGDMAVTTRRFIASNQEFELSEIKSAVGIVDNAWIGTSTIAGIGLLMILFGGIGAKVFGLAFCVGAFYFQKSTRTAALIVSGHKGERLYECEFKGGGNGAVLVATAITQAVRGWEEQVSNENRALADEKAKELKADLASMKSKS